jgi:hypothetical protein
LSFSFYLAAVPLLITAQQCNETRKARALAYPPNVPTMPPLFAFVAWSSLLLGLGIVISGFWREQWWSALLAFFLSSFFFTPQSPTHALLEGPKLIKVAYLVGIVSAWVYLHR